ncbi:hypothetical protein EI555_006822, partial [Monodon monoceros]
AQYCRWLNFGGVIKNYFRHREYSFTLEGYLRSLPILQQPDWNKIVGLVSETIHDEHQESFQNHHRLLQGWQHLKKVASRCQNNIENDKCGPWLYGQPKTDCTVLIDLQKVDQFDPFTVPTISAMCHELDTISTKKEAESDIKHRIRDYKKTSLAPYVKVSEQFLESLSKSTKGEIEKSDLQKHF